MDATASDKKRPPTPASAPTAPASASLTSALTETTVATSCAKNPHGAVSSHDTQPRKRMRTKERNSDEDVASSEEAHSVTDNGNGSTKEASKVTHEARWNEMFDRLVQYKQLHGHCNVPNRYAEDPRLGAWVSAQRRQYRIVTCGEDGSAAMTPERASRLVKLGFCWETTNPNHTPWSIRYQQLRNFVARFGHAEVPMRWEENIQLAHWVSKQRHDYKLRLDGTSSRLSDERVKLLNDVGFVWEASRWSPYKKLPGLNPGDDEGGQGADAPSVPQPQAIHSGPAPGPPVALPQERTWAPPGAGMSNNDASQHAATVSGALSAAQLASILPQVFGGTAGTATGQIASAEPPSVASMMFALQILAAMGGTAPPQANVPAAAAAPANVPATAAPPQSQPLRQPLQQPPPVPRPSVNANNVFANQLTSMIVPANQGVRQGPAPAHQQQVLAAIPASMLSMIQKMAQQGTNASRAVDPATTVPQQPGAASVSQQVAVPQAQSQLTNPGIQLQPGAAYLSHQSASVLPASALQQIMPWNQVVFSVPQGNSMLQQQQAPAAAASLPPAPVAYSNAQLFQQIMSMLAGAPQQQQAQPAVASILPQAAPPQPPNSMAQVGGTSSGAMSNAQPESQAATALSAQPEVVQQLLALLASQQQSASHPEAAVRAVSLLPGNTAAGPGSALLLVPINSLGGFFQLQALAGQQSSTGQQQPPPPVAPPNLVALPNYPPNNTFGGAHLPALAPIVVAPNNPNPNVAAAAALVHLNAPDQQQGDDNASCSAGEGATEV